MNKKTQHVVKHSHRKPYRMHHITMAGIALFVLLVSLVYVAIFFILHPTTPPASSETAAPDLHHSEVIPIRSSRGFALDVDKANFSIAATLEQVDEAKTISNPDKLRKPDQPITKLRLSPRSGTVTADARASTLTITHSKNGQDNSALTPFNNERYKKLETGEETIAGADFEKTVYQYTPRDHEDTKPIYSMAWSYRDSTGYYTILLQGLIGEPSIPAAYGDLIDSFRLGETLALQFFSAASPKWVSRSESTRQYLSDLISPAVVKLYHVVCGTVQFELQDIPEQQCRATTGSGFFISSEGHIATNGHVVVYEPEDALVDTLLSNPMQLSTYLSDVVGLTNDDISALERQPEELAWVVSQIYELSDDKVTFTDKNEAILAAIGSTPLTPETEEEVNELFSFRDTADIKRADIIDYSYSGKDKLNITSGSEEGFSSSDVALLRVKAENTPLIQLASPADASPGQSVTILGFPSDAENELVDRSELVATVTTGTISSVRTAAGGSGTLFQTDADASQGNSGGPAVTSSGKVVGLLTYRYKDATTQNAAKSYLRDADDIRKLLATQSGSLNLNSRTQQAWSEGLERYSASRFRDALEQFKLVANLYPPHRLVDTYITAAEANIAAGHDKSPPVLQYAGIIGGAGLLAVSIRLIVRHRAHHNAYKEHYGSAASPPPQQHIPHQSV